MGFRIRSLASEILIVTSVFKSKDENSKMIYYKRSGSSGQQVFQDALDYASADNPPIDLSNFLV